MRLVLALLRFIAFVPLFWQILSLQAQSLSSVVGGLSSTPTRPGGASLFWNPASAGFCRGTQIDSNLSFIGGWLIFEREGSDPNTGKPYSSSSTSGYAPNPYLSICSPLGLENFRFAYSTYFPAGAMADFTEGGSQRYDIISGLLLPWHHQLTLAYKPHPHWSIALSGIYSVAFFRTEVDVDLSHFMKSVLDTEEGIPSEHSSLASRARIPMTWTNGFGGGIGVLYSPNIQWSFGLSAFSPIFYEFSGNLKLEMPSLVSSLGSGLRALGLEQEVDTQIKARATLPAYIQFGFRYQPFGYWNGEYFGRYAFNSWSGGLSIEVTDSTVHRLKNYRRPGKKLEDTFLAGTVQTFTLFRSLAIGMNTTYTSNAVREDLLSAAQADFDSLMVGAFLQYDWSWAWSLGVEYAHTFMFERSAKGTEDAARDQTPDFLRPVSTDGNYRASTDRAGVYLKYAF